MTWRAPVDGWYHVTAPLPELEPAPPKLDPVDVVWFAICDVIRPPVAWAGRCIVSACLWLSTRIERR
jgi:hypothetical protein